MVRLRRTRDRLARSSRYTAQLARYLHHIAFNVDHIDTPPIVSDGWPDEIPTPVPFRQPDPPPTDVVQYSAPEKVNIQINVRLDRTEVPRAQMSILSKINIKNSLKLDASSYGGKYPNDMSGYKIITFLGAGEFSDVIRAKVVDTEKRVAIKRVNLVYVYRNGLEQQIVNEIESLSFLKHPNIITLYKVFFEVTKLFIVLEEAHYGSLYSYMRAQEDGTIEPEDAAKYISQIATALQYCHGKGIMHRDVKPENVFRDIHSNAKLGDFSWACPIRDTGHDEAYGTSEYFSPEMLLGIKYNETVDIWSLGVLSYEMLVGETPFPNSDREEMAQIIFSGKIPFPTEKSLPAAELITAMLQFHPHQRIPLADIIDDPWVKMYYNASYRM